MNPTTVSFENQLHLAREIARLARAQLPLDSALRELSGQTSGSLSQAARQVADRLAQGQSLADSVVAGSALEAHSLAAAMDLGMSAGRLDAAVTNWLDLQIARRNARRRLAVAMIYPGLLLSMALASIVFTMWRLLPQYEQAFLSLTDVQPAWLPALGWVHRNLGWLSVLMGAALVAPLVWQARRRVALNEFGLPREPSAGWFVNSFAARMAHIGLGSGAPIEQLVPRLQACLGLANTHLSKDWSTTLGTETSSTLISLQGGIISQSEAEDLLSLIGEQLYERAQERVEQDVRWLPMLAALCVGALVILAYTIVIYLPWVALFYHLSF